MTFSFSFFRGVAPALAFFSFFVATNGQTAGSSPSPSGGAKYGDLTQSAPVDVGLTSVQDNQYIVDIVLGGQPFKVIIDTGSTDLWVDMDGRDVQVVNNTDIVVDTAYAAGEVKGNVAFAELRLGPYVIPHQAFCNATNVTGMPEGVQGLMGMAFETARIYEGMEKAWGTESANELARGSMSNFLVQDPSTPGFFDLELGRTLLNGTNVNGHLFVGQHLASAADALAKAPKLERVHPNHWTVALDAMLINGKPFTGWNKSGVAGTPEGKVAAVFDSGFTTSAWPVDVIDAVYGAIPGAVKYDAPLPFPTIANAGTPHNWIVPCNASANISFVFGGQEYPVHPLDVVSFNPVLPITELDGIVLVANATICTNRFFAGTPTDEFDILLGMGFLRNVYGSFQYGNYTPPGFNITGQKPFVQLVSVTDKDAAWAEFYDYYNQSVVVGGPPEVDPANWAKFIKDLDLGSDDDSADNSTTSSTSTSLPSMGTTAASTQTGAGATPVSTASASIDDAQNLAVAGALAEDDASTKDSGSKYGTAALALLAANVVVGLAVLGVTLTLCIRGAKDRREARYKPLRLPKEGEGIDAERGPLYTD